jgi:hypothetical protein
VTALARNSTTNPVRPLAATRPPRAPPIPIPAFPATRETAVTRCRTSGAASVVSRVLWLGFSAPLPAPAQAAAANASAGECTKASPPYPAARAAPAPIAVARAPNRSISGPAAGETTTATPVIAPTTSPATLRLNPRPSCR